MTNQTLKSFDSIWMPKKLTTGYGWNELDALLKANREVGKTLSTISDLKFFSDDEYDSQTHQLEYFVKRFQQPCIQYSYYSAENMLNLEVFRNEMIDRKANLVYGQVISMENHMQSHFQDSDPIMPNLRIVVELPRVFDRPTLLVIETNSRIKITAYFGLERSVNAVTDNLNPDYQKWLDAFGKKIGIPLIRKEATRASTCVISKHGNDYNLTELKRKNSEWKPEEFHHINYPKIKHKKLEYFASTSGSNLKEGKLLLLHGVPGTGKTTYIRYLIDTQVHRDVRVIFVNTKMVDSFGSPSFINFALTRLQNSILVIEEAERLLVSRENNSDNSAISDLLNITDGVLGDALNMRVIATFNTTLEKIDAALLRDGRLYHHDSFEAHNFTEALAFLEYHLSKNPNKEKVEAFMNDFKNKKENNVYEHGTKTWTLAELYGMVNRLESNGED